MAIAVHSRNYDILINLINIQVDVFHAVKLIRINRPQLIDMKDEYKYLYDLMVNLAEFLNPSFKSFLASLVHDKS